MMTKTDGNAHIVQVGVADLSTEPSTHIGGDGVVPSEMLTNPITQVRRTLATLDPHRTYHPLQSRNAFHPLTLHLSPSYHHNSTPITQTPIRVLTETEALPVTLMTSELPDSAFDELKMLKVKGSSGSINFNVQGYARYGTLKGKSRCGSVVVVYTGQGHVQFDGVAMTFSESVAGAFERAGFAVTSRRRGRRAEDPDGHGLLGVREVMGKFNTLANMDLNTTLLSCGDDKPSMKPFFPLGDAPPSEIAFTEHLLIPCTFGWVEEDGSGAADLAECPDDDNDLNGEPDYVLDFGGRKFFKRIRTTRAKFFNGTFYSISEVTFPELAGYSLIELNNETHVTRYTKNDGDGGRAQHCRAGPIGEVGHGSGGHAITAESAKYVILDTADPAICIPPQPTIDFKGYEVLDGVYVRHFEVVRPDFFDCTTGVLRTKGYTTDYYEHFAENRMFAITMQNVYDRIETYESVTTAPDATLLQGPGMPSLDLDPAGAAEAFMSRPAECSSTDAARDLHAGFLIPEHFDLEFWEEDVAEDLADRARHTIDPEQAAELSKLLEDEEDPEQAIEAVVAAAGGSRTDKFEKCLKAAEVAYSEATLSEAANATFDAAERKCAGAGDTPSQAIIDCVDRLNLTSSDNASAAETDSIDSCFGDVLNKTGSGIHDVDGSGDGGDGGGRERKNHIWDFPVVRDDGWTPRSPYKKGEHCSMCKTDADCDRPNHLCIKLESEYDVIPGCTEYSKTRPLWDGVSGWGLFGAHAAGLSYCADPTDTVKLDSAATCTDNNKCSTCQGGCTADSQCGGDLVCRQRPFMSSDVFWEMERNVQKSCAENCNCCRGSICPGGGATYPDDLMSPRPAAFTRAEYNHYHDLLTYHHDGASCMQYEAHTFWRELMWDDADKEPSWIDYYNVNGRNYGSAAKCANQNLSPRPAHCHHPTKQGHDPIAGCAGSWEHGDYVRGMGYCAAPEVGANAAAYAVIADKAVAADGSKIPLEANNNPSKKTFCNSQNKWNRFAQGVTTNGAARVPNSYPVAPGLSGNNQVGIGPPSMCLNVETDPFLGGACVAKSMWCPIPITPMWSKFGVECGGYLIKKGPIELHLSGKLELLLGGPWVKDWRKCGRGCSTAQSCNKKMDAPLPTFDIILEVTGTFTHTAIGLEASIKLTAEFDAVSQVAKMAVELAISMGGFAVTGAAALEYEDVFGKEDGRGNKFYTRPTAAELAASITLPDFADCGKLKTWERVGLAVVTLGISEVVCWASGQTLSIGPYKIHLKPKRRRNRRLERRQRRARMARDAADAEVRAVHEAGRRRRAALGPDPKRIEIKTPQ